MTSWSILAAGGAAPVAAAASAWVAVLVADSAPDRRLAALHLPGGPRSSAQSSARSSRRWGLPSGAGHTTGDGPRPRAWAGPVLVLSILLLEPTLVGGPAGVVLALPAALAGHRFWRRAVTRQSAAAAAAARRQLPLLLDLVAAGLQSGATTDDALTLAADAVGPPADGALREVVAGLRLGASAAEAWSPVGQHSGLQDLARLAVRSRESGAAMAGACAELGRRERARRQLDAQAAVKRAGVWAVLPLALCYLPAFVLVGVVPLVVGLLQSLAV